MSNENLSLTIEEVAQLMKETPKIIRGWCRRFSEWFSFRAEYSAPLFDGDDIYILRLIKQEFEERNERSSDVRENYVKTKLNFDSEAERIKGIHKAERFRFAITSTGRFDYLKDYIWLESLQLNINKVVNIGCFAPKNGCLEASALLKILNASEITVIDKKEDIISEPQKPFPGTVLKFVQADITNLGDKVPRNHFDLAFCKNTLYIINDEQGVEGVLSALREMGSLVKLGGWVIVVEDWSEIPIDRENLVDIGLQKTQISGASEGACCYRKIEVVGDPSTT